MWKLENRPEGIRTVPEKDELDGICFYDTYEYKGLTKRAVKYYNSYTKVFTVFPHKFCSVNCAKRFLIERGMTQQASLMLMFAKRYYKYKKFNIIPAPMRDELHPYLPLSKGGIDIEIFRSSSSEGAIRTTSYPPFFIAPLMQWKRQVNLPFQFRIRARDVQEEDEEELERIQAKFKKKKTKEKEEKKQPQKVSKRKNIGVRGRLEEFLKKGEKKK